MSISIPPDLVPFVDDLIAAGTFGTPEDVVCAALAEMRDRRVRFEELKASVLEAKAEIDAGDGLSFAVDEILAEGRRMLSQRQVQ
jgi:Arc/MetJ-type ribon-helix-helix transcriptional regulator